ncbi:MAG: LysR family transcriptional regulator [Elainella sp.]
MNWQKLSQVELRQICYFMTVVQAGNNFSEAAKRLGIKQPPLSQSIQALEKLLASQSPAAQVKLFDRSRRPLELTPAGQVFLEEAQLALTHLDRAIVQAGRASRGEVGRLIIGFNNSIANSILPSVLQNFKKDSPDVELELREVAIEDEIPLLKAHQLDVVFQRSPYVQETDLELDFQPILDEYFIVALPENHSLAQQSKIQLQALQDCPIILPPLDILPFYENVIHLCREVGFEPKTLSTVTVTGVVAMLSLVAANVGVAILPNHVQTLHREGVVYCAIEQPKGVAENSRLSRQIAVVSRQDDPSPVLRNFLEVMKRTVLDSW